MSMISAQDWERFEDGLKMHIHLTSSILNMKHLATNKGSKEERFNKIYKIKEKNITIKNQHIT